jgi:Flp pilus assembly protein CpaB
VATASTYAFPTTLRRPLRLNRRRVLSVALMLAALIGGLGYVNGVGQPPTYPVLMAAHDLARGSVIGGGDFVPERVALPDSMAALTVPATSAAEVVGQRLAEPVHAGVPLLQAELATQTELVPGFQRIAFPIASEHAAGGRLNVGDSVRVYVTADRGKSNAHTTVTLDHARISAVGYQDVGLASTNGSSDAGAQRTQSKLAWVELLVEDDRAAEFVQTMASGDPDIAVLPMPQAAATTGAGR